MKKLSGDDRVRIVSALVEGCSIRSIVRMTGVSKNTVTKLLAELGKVCAAYHDEKVRNLTTKKVQCDEIWSFVHSKQKNVPEEKKGVVGIGDVWTWVALDAESKLVISYLAGSRDAGYATEFMQDVASRLTKRVQLTTDGHKAYLEAVDTAFGGAAGVDYAQLIKIYGEPRQTEARYSPAVCEGTRVNDVCGMPDSRHVSTSYVERQNLTMRMAMRRFTRLTNAFSKKLENHIAALALHYIHYNFCRIHQTLRITPAMAAGIESRVWEIEDIVALLEAQELAVIGTDENKRGPYKKAKSSD